MQLTDLCLIGCMILQSSRQSKELKIEKTDKSRTYPNLTGIIQLTFIMFRTLKQPYGNSLRAKEVLGIDN